MSNALSIKYIKPSKPAGLKNVTSKELNSLLFSLECIINRLYLFCIELAIFYKFLPWM
jgi:hypothetical protein